MWIKKVSLLWFLSLLVLILVGCRQTTRPFESTGDTAEPMSQPPTATTTPVTPTHILTLTSNPTKTQTDIPITPIAELLSSLDPQEDQVHFLAYKHDCELPAVFDITDSDPNCTSVGIVTEDVVLFSDIAGFQLLRVGYEMDDGVAIPDAFIQNTVIKVFEYQQDLGYEDLAPLIEASLSSEDGHPGLIFAEIELTALHKNDIAAFHVVVMGIEDQVYRDDLVAFDEQALKAFIEGSDADQDPANQPGPITLPIFPSTTNTLPPASTQLPHATNTRPPFTTATKQPSPTATRTPSPTATRTPSPTATRTPSPTATRTPSPTATQSPPTATQPPPTATQPPPTATLPPPTATQPPPTATQPPPTSTATPEHSPTVRTPWISPPTATPTKPG